MPLCQWPTGLDKNSKSSLPCRAPSCDGNLHTPSLQTVPQATTDHNDLTALSRVLSLVDSLRHLCYLSKFYIVERGRAYTVIS